MELVEVQFKAQRKEIYVNTRALYLRTGNYCVVQADRGEDMGLIVSIARVSAKDVDSDMKEVLRHATDNDLSQLEESRTKEQEALKVCQQKATEHDLPIKLVDVEFQFDGNKITFYFTADGRIDFRELVKDLAGIFRTRIDLRQIGVRDEARRFDGMGMCGRRLCCSTWLKDFEPVTLKMAKDQSLPLTPSKISGACGRLMCCLSYELSDYKELARDIPKIGSKLSCFGGRHRLEKIDIFRSSAILSDEDGNTIEVLIEELKEELARVARGESTVAPEGGAAGPGRTGPDRPGTRETGTRGPRTPRRGAPRSRRDAGRQEEGRRSERSGGEKQDRGGDQSRGGQSAGKDGTARSGDQDDGQRRQGGGRSGRRRGRRR